MLEKVKALEVQGEWLEIRRCECALLESVAEADRARAYLSLSKAYESTATSRTDYLTALRFTRQAVCAAYPGSLLHTWALARSAAMMADMGDFKGAEKAGTQFFAALPEHPLAAQVAPWASSAMGRVRSRQGRHAEAVAHLRDALSAGVGGEFDERHGLTLARVLARAGRTTEAIAFLPSDTKHVPVSKVHGAKALILASAGDWSGAYAEARQALRSVVAGEWSVFDLVEVAELLLTLKRSTHALGLHCASATWQNIYLRNLHTAATGLGDHLTANLCEEGGVWLDAAISRSGPVGTHRSGLRGAVG